MPAVFGGTGRFDKSGDGIADISGCCCWACICGGIETAGRS